MTLSAPSESTDPILFPGVKPEDIQDEDTGDRKQMDVEMSEGDGVGTTPKADGEVPNLKTRFGDTESPIIQKGTWSN